MAITHKSTFTNRYGEVEKSKNVFDKFKAYKDKNTGELKYRARETNSNKLTREIYNVKGQMIFRMRVSSYKVHKNTLIRDFVSEEEIIVDRGLLQSNIAEVVENAKLQATYSHMRKKGDIDLINDTKRLKNEIIKIELLDYIVDYNKGYSRKNKISYLKFEKDDEGNTETYIYDDKTKQYNVYTVTPKKSVKDRRIELDNIKIRQERNYTTYY